MERRYTTVDKSAWPARGQWDDEPDKVQWVDEATGLDCLIVRGPVGAWCGYVGVSEGHRFYGLHYDQCQRVGPGVDEDAWLDVHGGLTFSDFCHEGPDPSRGICHVAFAGRPERVWWLGFDCAHSGDIAPSYDSVLSRHEPYASYKGEQYVRRECAKLARQLADLVPTDAPTGAESEATDE